MIRPKGLGQALLAGLASVLVLAASNVDQGLVFSDLRTPILVAGFVSTIAWLVAGFFGRNPANRGIIAVTLTFGWLFYGYYAGPIERLLPVGTVASVLITFGVLSAAWLVIAGWLGRRKGDLSELSRGLTAALAAIAVLASLHVLIGLRPRPLEAPATALGSEQPPGIAAREAPSIYLIILDAYSRSDHLLEIYDFDNTSFERKLEELGFQVPQLARANYTSTFQAVAAMLNRDYLDALGIDVDPGSTERGAVYHLVEENRTATDLLGAGYEFVFFRSPYPALSRNRLADRQIPERLSGEFEKYFTARTILAPVVLGYCAATKCFEGAWPFTPEGPEQVRSKFAALAELASDPRPRFVFAHFLLPHEPFRVDSTCAPIEPLWPQTFDEREEEEVRKLYPMQVQCVNRLVLETVEAILDNSARDPIILIQADHGYGRFPWGIPTELESTDPERVQERLSVFAAYRFPGENAPVVTSTISPVNVFRLVFSSYFGREDLMPLEDRSFWSGWDRPYMHTRVAMPGE